MTRLCVALVLVLLALPMALSAQEVPTRRGGFGGGSPAAGAAAPRTALLPQNSVTQHTITVDGRPLAYTATAGSLALQDQSGQATAEIFYVSFMLKNAGDAAHRPITYLVNGGPGASSAYLDIGAIGPRALAFPANGTLPPPVDRVADNPDTWLPFTDLVFIDPVGTGWSRAADESRAPKEFWTVSSDIAEIEDIIRRHVTGIGRLGSPLYLVGESYGGYRVARLAHDLAVDTGIAPQGVIMISPVIDFGLMFGGQDDALSAALRLPSYAAAKRGAAASLAPNGLADVEQFAMHDYLLALSDGTPEGASAAPLYQKLAALTGIGQDRIAEWHGRIPLYAYVRDVEGSEGRVVSRYDAEISETDPNPAGQNGFDDPVLDASLAPFTSAFVAYAADELGFKTDLPFELLSRDVGRHWDWETGRGPVSSVDASDALRRGLALEPQLRVMIAHGVTDLETPYMMSRYIRDHMPAPLAGRVSLKLYAGGHMLYLRPDSRRRLRADAAAFYGPAAE